MRKFTLLLALAGLFAAATAQAQTPGTKGDGQVFFTETFGWENPADDKGWTAPTGYSFEDPLDLGTNWVWWPAGKGFVNFYTQDPPMKSTTKDNGCLALFAEEYNMVTGVLVATMIDNSIVFPTMDFSDRPSVVVRYQTHFMAWSVAVMWLEITTDDWVHTAQVNLNFGCGHKQRPGDKAKGEPALFEANISDVVAGNANVKMRIRWKDTDMYYWAIDDFTLSEAYNNDMRLNFVSMEWEDNNPNTAMAWISSIPKSQLDGTVGFNNFKSATLNLGEEDQEAVYMDVNITKAGNNVFSKSSTPLDVAVLEIDTADIADLYKPVDYGHYKVAWEFKAKVADDNPANNKREAYFNVTDSVYSRSGPVNTGGWLMGKESYTTAAAENLNHFAGSIFPIFGDCEINSISTYITGGKADAMLNYRFTVFYAPEGLIENSFELMTTDMVQLDSADFNTWVTMPFSTKDGESEFLKKGDLVYAGYQFDNTNPEWIIRRNQGMEVGTDNSVKLSESSMVVFFDGSYGTGLGSYYGQQNLMVHLNLNDQGNQVDGVDLNPALAEMGQNYPNPFNRNNGTKITYKLTSGSDVSFEVMDLTGRKVLQVNQGMMPAGEHNFTMETNNLDAGVYFYTLRAGSFVQTKQMVIVE